jgi:putative transposase
MCFMPIKTSRTARGSFFIMPVKNAKTVKSHIKKPNNLDNDTKICKNNLDNETILVDQCWKTLPDHFPDCAIDDYIVMPDHFHGIIELKNDTSDLGAIRVGNMHLCAVAFLTCVAFRSFSVEGAKQVAKVHACSVHPNACSLQYRQHQRIPVIIGAFKSASSRLIRQSGYPEFKWHKSYYDRILRRNELPRIRQYIRNNPNNYNLK